MEKEAVSRKQIGEMLSLVTKCTSGEIDYKNADTLKQLKELGVAAKKLQALLYYVDRGCCGRIHFCGDRCGKECPL